MSSAPLGARCEADYPLIQERRRVSNESKSAGRFVVACILYALLTALFLYSVFLLLRFGWPAIRTYLV